MLGLQDTNVSGVLEEQEQSPAEVERKMQPLLPAQAPTNPSSRWKSEVHWDGLAVYREPESNTYATSCTMRASPRSVFQHLVHLADGSSAWSFFQDCQVLGKAPEDADGLVCLFLLCTRKGSYRACSCISTPHCFSATSDKQATEHTL